MAFSLVFKVNPDTLFNELIVIKEVAHFLNGFHCILIISRRCGLVKQNAGSMINMVSKVIKIQNSCHFAQIYSQFDLQLLILMQRGTSIAFVFDSSGEARAYLIMFGYLYAKA